MDTTKTLTQPPPTSLPSPEIIFVNWRELLHQLNLAVPVRQAYAQGIEAYLDYCRRNGLSVGVETARGFMADALRRGLTHEADTWKEGLNWFFREGRKRTAPRLGGVPSLGQADTGITPWERRLIAQLRLKHYSWRTEQSYRDWAWRLDRFLHGRGLESACGEDIKEFLSRLTVQARVSVSTQKQRRAQTRGKERGPALTCFDPLHD